MCLHVTTAMLANSRTMPYAHVQAESLLVHVQNPHIKTVEEVAVTHLQSVAHPPEAVHHQ